MFDNIFSPSPGVWVALIGGVIALPILIHLINLMRHKTVEWAAMEFLLKSYKKNKNWVWLKQLLLLLSRIAALLLALFLLGQVGCEDDRISKLLGGSTTHHYVLLDDSFSMNDRTAEGSAFDRARATLSSIAARAKNRQNQKFTLLRFSKAQSITTGDDQESVTSVVADLNGELVDNLFETKIENTKALLEASNLSVGIKPALDTATDLINSRENENAIVYVLSDFREKDWEAATEIQQQMRELHQTGAGIELINCVKSTQLNLAITELEAIGNVRVAGTPLMMKISVKNCSDIAASKVQVKLASQTFDSTNELSETSLAGDSEELPTVFIQRIAPGETQTRQFPVFFNTTGIHGVRATLGNDAVANDNERWNATRFENSARVLLIDDEQQMHSRFLSLALNPGGMTGVQPEVRTRDFLRDASLEQLNRFDAIFLLDVDRFDESAIANLEEYTNQGGGLAFFLGPKTNLAHYSQLLHKNGEGVFPMPLERVVEVPELLEERIPDVAPEKHPLFPEGMNNAFLNMVQIKSIIQPPIEWKPDTNSGVTVAATVRGEQSWPLVLSSRFGAGNVIVFTTTAGPVWNNWTRSGTFPPLMLFVEDMIAAGRYPTFDNQVGAPIEATVPINNYGPDVTVFMPPNDVASNAPLISGSYKMGFVEENRNFYELSIGQGNELEGAVNTNQSGFYNLIFSRADGTSEVNRLALNIDTNESEMALAKSQAILSLLSESNPTLVNWDSFNPEPKQKSASSLSKLLLFLFIALLIGEQLLAYSCSYHSKSSGASTPNTTSRKQAEQHRKRRMHSNQPEPVSSPES